MITCTELMGCQWETPSLFFIFRLSIHILSKNFVTEKNLYGSKIQRVWQWLRLIKYASWQQRHFDTKTFAYTKSLRCGVTKYSSASMFVWNVYYIINFIEWMNHLLNSTPFFFQPVEKGKKNCRNYICVYGFILEMCVNREEGRLLKFFLSQEPLKGERVSIE